MREVGNGLYEIESQDGLEKLDDAMSTVAERERVRLNAKHLDQPWWADAVFHIHDMMAFGSLIRHTLDNETANAFIQTVTESGMRLLEHIMGGERKEASKVWVALLLDAHALDGVLQQHVRKEAGKRDDA